MSEVRNAGTGLNHKDTKYTKRIRTHPAGASLCLCAFVVNSGTSADFLTV